MLFVYSHNGNMAVISQLFCMAGFKKICKKPMFTWYCKDDINIFIGSKAADSIKEIIKPDEVKLRVIIGEYFFQLITFNPEFFSQFHIMFIVNIHNMQIRFEHI